jgi:hypothetical protein
LASFAINQVKVSTHIVLTEPKLIKNFLILFFYSTLAELLKKNLYNIFYHTQLNYEQLYCLLLWPVRHNLFFRLMMWSNMYENFFTSSHYYALVIFF